MALPKKILDAIESNKTYLGDNPSLPNGIDDCFLLSLVEKHYENTLDAIKSDKIDDIMFSLSRDIEKCKIIEGNNIATFEELCFKIVNHIFKIPKDTLILNMKLVDRIDTKQERIKPESIDGYSFENINGIKNLTDEIYKRRMLNTLILGASICYAENIGMYSKYLENSYSPLKEAYRHIFNINDYLIYHDVPDNIYDGKDGGKVDVYISSEYEPVRIEAQAVLFPILLEETIRGILELSISHGLPKEKEKAEYIIGKTDFKLGEVWEQRLGVPLFLRLYKVMRNVGESPMDIGLNFIFMELSMLATDRFNIFMQNVLSNTKEGRKLIKSLCRKIRRRKEMDDFNDYILSQRDKENKLSINDSDVFTSDELVSNDLCNGTILDEEI